MAGAVPRRHGPAHVEYANDEKNTESVTTLRLHVGGGGRPARRRRRHPLAHECGERDRVHRHRCRAPGHSLCPGEGARRDSTRVLRGGRDTRADRDRRAPSHGLHRLPQSSQPRECRHGGARRQPGDGAGPYPGDAAVRPPRSGERVEAGLPSHEAGTGEIARVLREFYRTEQPQVSQARAASLSAHASSVHRVILRASVQSRDCGAEQDVTRGPGDSRCAIFPRLRKNHHRCAACSGHRIGMVRTVWVAALDAMA